MSSYWNGRRVAVTGAAGMLGSYLCERLVGSGADVLGLDNFSRGKNEVDNAVYINADMRDACQCEAWFEGCDVVFNLAASCGGLYFNIAKQLEQYTENSLLQTSPVLAAAKVKVPVFVQVSSVCVYADGFNAPAIECNGFVAEPEPANSGYAWAKRMGEKACAWAFGKETRYVIARPSNMYSECFSGDTEVMTPNGTRNIKDIEIGDTVYTLNPSTKEVEYSKVIARQEKYADELFAFDSPTIDFRVTPKHKMYYRTSTDFQLKSAEFFRKRAGKSTGQMQLATHKPMDCKEDGQQYIYLGEYIDDKHIVESGYVRDHNHSHSKRVPYTYGLDDWAEFLGWYISEGSIADIPRKEGFSYQIRITQSHTANAENCQRIKSLFERMGIDAGYDGYSFYFTSRLIKNYLDNVVGRGSHNKHLPSFVFEETCSYRTRKILFNTLMAGDGSKSKSAYYTTSTSLKDDFIHLCFLLGRQAIGRFKNKIWQIGVHKADRHNTAKYHHISVENVYEKVYCITAEKNHIIYAGRNGIFNWIGQCDYFDDKAHVIPALIRKFATQDHVTVYGGSQSREFLYADDCARALMVLAEHGKNGNAYNVGTNGETCVTIARLAAMIKAMTGSDAIAEFDQSQAIGDNKRWTDASKLNALGWDYEINLQDGLKQTVEAYLGSR